MLFKFFVQRAQSRYFLNTPRRCVRLVTRAKEHFNLRNSNNVLKCCEKSFM